mmetsp:Transcript_27125/g.68128  ORF Transcript_27125/g.68128 Transcript_27125/m.68128 type:complete len:349 (+) Transcript_27125:577-1623(+)
MKLSSPTHLFTEILDQLKASGVVTHPTAHVSHKENLSVLEALLREQSHMVVIVADEIDQLHQKNELILYQLFELATKPDNHCILIAIANRLDFTSTLLDRLHNRGCEPQTVHFPSYSRDQLMDIVQERLDRALCLPTGEMLDVFDSKAVRLCAARVSNVVGDARRALDVCAEAVARLQERIRNAEAIGKAALPSKVTVADINAVTKGGSLQSTSVLQSLPLHQQLLVCAILLLQSGSSSSSSSTNRRSTALSSAHKSKSVGANDPTASQAFELTAVRGQYSNLCRRNRLKALPNATMQTSLDALAGNGVISMSRNRSKVVVSLLATKESIQEAYEDNRLLKTVLESLN